MAIKKFESPREEALEIARQTRKDVLQGKAETVSVLRACLAIAESLNKASDMEWIMSELSGYIFTILDFPDYRKVLCRYEVKGIMQDDFLPLNLKFPVHLILQYIKREETMRVDSEGKTILVNVPTLENLLARIIDRCFFFLNNVIKELQYGGVVEYLMEEIRKNTDEKLAKLDTKLTDETQSLFLNLTSTNPADWNKVGHSCRKILSLLADKVFSPSDEPYKMKDERTIKVGAPEFINRLCAFFDQKMSGDERKFVMAEIVYLEAYLRQVVEYDQMGEHKPSIEKFHADMMAIHTYLIASEILKHVTVS